MTSPIAHQERMTLMCTDCNRGFTTKVGLCRHQRYHSHPYVCSHCKEGFHSWSLFSAHMRTHPGEKSYTLSGKDDAVVTVENASICEKAHTSNKPFVCSECGEGFMLVRSLEAHGRTHTVKGKITIRKPPLICLQCSWKFCTPESLRVHISTYHPEEGVDGHATVKSYVCSQCGIGFDDTTNLDTHVEKHVKIGGEIWLCGCRRRFNTNAELIAHQGGNTDQESHPYNKCTYCGDSFISYVNLTRHINSAHIIRYKCPECGEGFSQEKSVKAHMIIHTEAKQFKCCECDEVFTKLDSLTVHVRVVHRNERTCLHCGKVLSTWSNLMQHIKTFHTSKAKPEIASDCFKVENDKDNSELQTPNNSVEMQCTQCGEVFSHAVDKTDIGGPNPIICPSCTNEFSQMFGIKLDS